MPAPLFDVLTATAEELALHMTEGRLTSVGIVHQYFEQIGGHNRDGLCLRAIASVAERDIVLAQATRLDEERRQGKLRGPLHGVPILIKDCIVTSPSLGMETTSGAAALVGATAKANATLVDQLLRDGLIVIGKASMTEWCGDKAKNTTCGWSASNGQTQSPHIKGGHRKGDLFYGRSLPGGSSAGSGAGVAAGFAPFSIGTETGGSTIFPAGRAGLYSLVTTLHTVPSEGIYTISKLLDRVGIMAKSPGDILTLLPTVQNLAVTGPLREVPSRPLKYGFVDPKDWISSSLPSEWEGGEAIVEQFTASYHEARKLIAKSGNAVVYPLPFPEWSTVKSLSDDPRGPLYEVGYHSIRDNIGHFLNTFEDAPVSSLKELVDWNEAHKEKAMPAPHPTQECLLDALNDKSDPETIMKLRRDVVKAAGLQGIDKVMAENEIDVIVVPGESMGCAWASAAGYPLATVPIDNLDHNDQPIGLLLLARGMEDLILIRVMQEFQSVLPPRKVPTLLK